MTDSSVTWTDERVETLKRLWSEGLSASHIAAELGGVTRNAVIGKVHRLGLSGRGKAPAQTPARQRPKATPRTAAPSAPPSNPTVGNVAVALAQVVTDPAVAILPRERPVSEVVVPLSERVTIMDLRESMCRWPMGDPTSAEFRFCGARSLTGLPYCEHHCSIAYQPAADRKRDRRAARA